MKRNQFIILITIIALGFVGMIVYSIFTAVSRSGKEPVPVYIVPPEAIVTANGQRLSAGTQYLPAGTYAIEAKSEGFADYKGSVTITAQNKEIIDIGLQPVSDKAKEWAEKNQKLYLEREGRGGKRSRERGTDFFAANPIARKLPVKELVFTISYTMDESDPTGMSLILEIDAPEGYREAALRKVRELGYEPTNFKINFKTYESPFANE